jgi:hypothetical protein
MNISRGAKSIYARRLALPILATSLLVSLTSPAHADFNYPDFSSVAGLTFNGNAAQDGVVLRVTPDLEGQAGSVYYTTTKQHLAGGFDTTFGIRMSGANPSGDGMTFIIQDDSAGALGGGGSDLGFSSIPRSLVIEFDTFGFFPETDNHISVQTRGTDPNSPEDIYSLAQSNVRTVDLNDGQSHAILIRYRPGVLQVMLNGSDTPIIDIVVDLENIGGASILDGSGDAWVGFTAGTGAATENHDVEFWSFDEASFPLPPGPCCTTSGCIIATAHDCVTLLAGYFVGPYNGSCDGVSCTGPCCNGDICEQDIELADCIAGGGTFMGVRQGGTGCDSGECEGACCTLEGCLIATEPDCTFTYGGVFQGPGTSCGPFPCTLPDVGACCITNECLQMTESECANQTGIWYGMGTNCFNVNCFNPPPPLGACCQPGNVCVDGVAETVCELFNGTYNGDASLCVNSDCAGSCDCQSAVVLPDNSFGAYSTTGAPVCDGGACAGTSPANIFAYTPSQDGYGLVNTCNGSNFDTVISVHSGCPMTPANQIACDTSTCGQDAQVYFCVEASQTYYIRVGGEGGASGDYNLLALLLVGEIFEGPIQNPGTGHWYYHTTQAPWTILEQLAISKGGHLVTINDAAENEWVRANFAAGTAVSIGINDAAVEGTFAWPNGDPVGYTNWASGEPNGPSPEDDHGLMLDDGTWRDETSCYAGVYRGVIEVNTVPLPGVLAGPFNNPANCHDYYILNPGTWIEAQHQAEALGGDLVTINDAPENEWVRSNFANFGSQQQPIWVGLSDVAVEGTYVWADGAPLGYANWAAGEPNNLGNEDYVMMSDAVTGEWNDAHSGLHFSGVVELPAANCPCTCWGDVNGDAAVRGDDIQRFVNCFIAAAGGPHTPGCSCADVNHDGFVNAADITAMANAALNAPNCAP